MIAPVYLVLGEAFLSDEALQRVRSEAETDPLSEATFGSDDDADRILEALSTPSLLGGRRLVIVHDAQDLKKDQVAALADYIRSPSPDAILVLLARTRTKLDAVVKDVGQVISLEAPRGRGLVGWLRERARVHGLRLDDRGAWTLLDAVGTELRDLDAALTQLANALEPDARVGPPDIKRIFPRLADENIYALTDALGDRKLPAAMTALRRLLEQGDEPLLVFGSLVAHVRRLLRARPHAERGPRHVAQAMGLPGWRAERLARQARAYSEGELVEALTILARADIDLKSGEMLPEAALERAVVEIVAGTRVSN